MYKFWIILALSTGLYACQSTGNNEQTTSDESRMDRMMDPIATQATVEAEVDTVNAPVFEFKEPIYTFGTIQEGEKVEHLYEFTNTGKSPLIISDVQASCGCTTPEFTKEPVKPGEKGTIKVIFNSQGQRGKQQKIISILSNAHPRLNHVQLKGEVKE